MISGLPPARPPRAGSLSLPGPAAPRPRPSLSHPAPPDENPLLPSDALRHAALAGARIREAIRIYVELEKVPVWARVTCSWVVLVEQGNFEQRVEITTYTRVSMDYSRGSASISESAVEILSTGHDGVKPLLSQRREISRKEANLEHKVMKVFDAYVKALKDFRTSPENTTHEQLPVVQARHLDQDLSIATAAGSVPIGMSGAAGASMKAVLPKVVQKSAVVLRWSSMRLSKYLGKAVAPDKIVGAGTKWAQGIGFPKTLEAAQSKYGRQFLASQNYRLALYTDFRMSGQSIYSNDVSPEWVKEAHHWLYELVFGGLHRLFPIK